MPFRVLGPGVPVASFLGVLVLPCGSRLWVPARLPPRGLGCASCAPPSLCSFLVVNMLTLPFREPQLTQDMGGKTPHRPRCNLLSAKAVPL